jgi:hypothetical protein
LTYVLTITNLECGGLESPWKRSMRSDIVQGRAWVNPVLSHLGLLYY